MNNHYELITAAGLRGREVHWISPDLSGRVWIGTDKEMAMWDGECFQNMTGETNLNVAFFLFMRDGSAVVGADGRLRKYAEGNWVRELDAWPDLMQEQQLQFSLNEDREGGVWRVSRGLGIFHILSGGGTEQVTLTNGLPGEHTTSWLEDREGDIWVGLGNAGLARLRKKHFETIGMLTEKNDRPAKSVCEDADGALWIGNYGGGLERWQDGSLTHYQVQAQTPGDFVFSVFPWGSRQLLMSAGMEDAFIFDNGRVRPAPFAVHGIKCILVDRRGRVWMGRKDGVDSWENGTLREWNSHNGSIAKPVRVVVQDVHDGIWIGSDDGSIYRADNDKLTKFELPEFPATQAVWSLSPDDDGSLWIGTSDAGLLHFKSGSFERFTAREGLPDDMICQILDDQQGNLWLGSHHGICRVSKIGLNNFVDRKNFTIPCSVYGRSDGLPSLQCADMYQPSAWRGYDGKLWFATVKGVVGVQPREMTVNSNLPPVVIEEFLVDGKIRSGKDVEIAPGKQNFEFRYTALSLPDADKVHFRYKLEGFDADWVDAGSRRWVQYNFLNPGVYHFRVMACNNDGLWNETGASLDFRLQPHFWETWRFRGFLLLSFIGVTIAVVRHISGRELRLKVQRLKRQRDLEQERARIARDIHDHLGSGLTRINLLNELLLGESAVQLPNRVRQITKLTCELMQVMDEIVWAVNPKNDTLENLMAYLCDFAEEFLRTANISFRLRVPAPLPDWHLTSEVRHNLFLAVKEILNNAVKHSQATEVFLELKLNPDSFRLDIRDNGRGLEESRRQNPFTGLSKNNGNGLENIRKRAMAIGGHCRINGEPEKGTQIQIHVPRTYERKK